jgi:hypothetical protein
MDQIKTIFCLGNQTENSYIQTTAWAKKFDIPYYKLNDINNIECPGVFMSDLEIMTVDQIWQVTNQVDLLIFLDQPVSSFDFIETYRHFEGLCLYKKHFMPVMIAKNDAPNLWIDKADNNQKIYDHLFEQNILDCNLIIKLGRVYDLDQFASQLEQLHCELKKRNCRWIFYRAGEHEPLHYEVTKILLTYPEFVLLSPEVFNGNVQGNIVKQIYHHWVNLYLRKKHARS